MNIRTLAAILSTATCIGCSKPPPPTDQFALPSGAYSNILIYTVQEGDTLGSVARLFVVPKDDILKLNPQLRNKDQVTPGQRLLIPSITNQE